MDRKTIELFSSKKTDHWQTPPELYRKLDEEFKFNFDPCPLNPTFDGLSVPWKERNFCNPPYSKITAFLQKAHAEFLNGISEVTVFLCFANTDTRWFHDYVYYHSDEIRFLRKRLKFLNYYGQEQSAAMRPSMVVVFRRPKMMTLLKNMREIHECCKKLHGKNHAKPALFLKSSFEKAFELRPVQYEKEES